MIKQVAAGRYKLIARDWYFDEPEIMNWFHTGLREAMQANPPVNYTNYGEALELVWFVRRRK
jgi:hypothetical protein